MQPLHKTESPVEMGGEKMKKKKRGKKLKLKKRLGLNKKKQGRHGNQFEMDDKMEGEFTCLEKPTTDHKGRSFRIPSLTDSSRDRWLMRPKTSEPYCWSPGLRAFV